ADLVDVDVKTKTFHWHLAGAHFRDYHLLFDEHADQIFDAIDLLAERVRRVGGTTIRSIGHIGQLQTIADDNREFVPAPNMVQRLMGDNGALARSMRSAHEICEHSRDVATASILETLIDEAERRKWFLFEVTQASDRSAKRSRDSHGKATQTHLWQRWRKDSHGQPTREPPQPTRQADPATGDDDRRRQPRTKRRVLAHDRSWRP